MPHKNIHAHGLLHHYFSNKQIDGLYGSVALKSFAESFIAIFVPVYLLTLGFSIQNIALYFLVYLTSVLLCFPFGLTLNSKIGIKKTMGVGIFFLIIGYLLLNSLQFGNIHYLFVAFVFGTSTGFYWSGFHLEFSKFSDKRKEASEISMLNILAMTAGAAGPLLGAIFISKISFNFLFLIVSGLLLLSVVPLFFTKDTKIKYKFSLKETLRADTKKKAMAYQASAVLGIANAIFWPLFIFLTLKNVLSLGIIITVTAFIEIIFLFFIGKLSDKHKYKVLKIGIFSHSFSWLGRLLFLTPIGIFLSNLYSSLSSALIRLPFTKIIYERSKNVKRAPAYFLFREFHMAIGRIFILLVVILTGSIFWLFIISFFVTFVYSVLFRKARR
ncbi:MAG TPA: MFS transporter [Candidatus Pacearchaeota archaeon]|nr:MFS transporter [Candidatus Pacearchaeota archaeon]